MVVARNAQDTSMRRGARRIGVTQDIHGSIDPRTLAVPNPKHPIFIGLIVQSHLLGAPDGSGCQVFVDARLEMDIVVPKELIRALKLPVIKTQRRPAIAGNKSRRVEACRPVPSDSAPTAAAQAPEDRTSTRARLSVHICLKV